MSAIDRVQLQSDLVVCAYSSEVASVSDTTFAALGGTWTEHHNDGSDDLRLTGDNEITCQRDGWYALRGYLDSTAVTGTVQAALTRNDFLVGVAPNTGDSDREMRETLLGGQGQTAAGIPLLWQGFARAGDTFSVVCAVSLENFASNVSARLVGSRLSSHPEEYAGQLFWDVALDPGVAGIDRAVLDIESCDTFRSAAKTACFDADPVQFAVNRPTGEPRYQETGGANRPSYLFDGFSGGLPCVQFAGDDYLEDNAHASDYDGDVSHIIVVTIEAATPGDVNRIFDVYATGGGNGIAMYEIGGGIELDRAGKFFTTGISIPVATPITVVWSYDSSTGASSAWSINADGSVITSAGSWGHSGSIGPLNAKTIGLIPGDTNNNFLLRRFREVVGRTATPGLLQQLAAEIARDDT